MGYDRKGNSIGISVILWSGNGDLVSSNIWERKLNGIFWIYFFFDFLKLLGLVNFLFMVIFEVGFRDRNL